MPTQVPTLQAATGCSWQLHDCARQMSSATWHRGDNHHLRLASNCMSCRISSISRLCIWIDEWSVHGSQGDTHQHTENCQEIDRLEKLAYAEESLQLPEPQARRGRHFVLRRMQQIVHASRNGWPTAILPRGSTRCRPSVWLRNATCAALPSHLQAA